jgi:hypothetical protein
MRSSRRFSSLPAALAAGLVLLLAPAATRAQTGADLYRQMQQAQQAQQQQLSNDGQQSLSAPTPGLMTQSSASSNPLQVPNLLPPQTTTNRSGSSTEAEAGAGAV